MFYNKLTIALLLAFCNFIFAQQMTVDLNGAAFPPKSKPEYDANGNTTTTTVAPTYKPTTSSSTSSTSTTTSTTTPAPHTTTTTAPVTTTLAPTPYPAPTIGQWNSSCIMVKMAAQLNFTYETQNNNITTALFNIPPDAKVDHALCDSATSQSIQINWGPDVAQNSLSLQFDKKNSSTLLSMIKINLSLTGDDFPNAKPNETIQLLHRGADFDTPIKMSYHCTYAQTLNMTETIQSKDIIGTITVSDVQTEAFRSANATGFSTVHDCDSSETSDVVPIAVGIALIALILIVLISYLCARRRAISRGYMSF